MMSNNNVNKTRQTFVFILDFLFHLVKSDKQLLSNELTSKVNWNSSAFLGPNLWDKDQLYTANGNLANNGSTTTSSTTNNNGSNNNNNNLHTEKNGNFKVENIDIDEFLCENNLNLNDIESFSNHFENVDQPTSNSPHQNQDPLLLHSPMQAAPAKSPDQDSISNYHLRLLLLLLLHHHSLLSLGRQSSNSSRKYSQDETSNKISKQSRKNRKAQHQLKVRCSSFFCFDVGICLFCFV